MLRLDVSAKSLQAVSATTLTRVNVLERHNLQAAILNSWPAWCGEMGYEDLYLIGSEIVPHDSCADRIDILALSRDGTPVVFELKRHRDRLQLLQAISYAAMVSRWDKARYLRQLGARNDDDADELRSLLEDDEFEIGGPEIVLVAETFDPEVILASDWLGKFGVPISAFAISVADHKGDILLTLAQKFPLAGVDDVYTRRSTRVREAGAGTSWDEVLNVVQFSFARRAVEIFRRRSEGSPQRRAFFSIYGGSPIGRMRISFMLHYLRIYTVDQSAEAESALRSRLGTVVPFQKWGNESTKNSGYTFRVDNEMQFEKFLDAVGENPFPSVE